MLKFAGWTPSTFVSSRSDRAKKKVFRPQDFMDDEDLQEIKESMNLVDATEAMDLTGGAEAELGRRAAEEYESESVLSSMVLILSPNKCCFKKSGEKRIGTGIDTATEGISRSQSLEKNGMETGSRHWPPNFLSNAQTARYASCHGKIVEIIRYRCHGGRRGSQ